MKRGPKTLPTLPCRVEGCDRPSQVKVARLCARHYYRLTRYGDVNAPTKSPGLPAAPDRPCSVSGCPNMAKVKSRALCTRHYLRWQRYLDPNAPWRKADLWTEREDELVLALPLTKTGRARPGTLTQLAMELGRSIHGVATRRHVLTCRPQ